MTAYYNEIEPYCNAWLQNLMDAGEIAPGTIDDRSILDVTPKDLAGHDRCHFFAGIAGWDYALRLAGWPEDQLVWTGSCPCQPFSPAGRGGGGADERHLWPAWFWLIRQCRPSIIFGEQVASKAGLAWLDVVFSDLEAAGYTCGAADLCAAGLGAPHIRQRLWFVALENTKIEGTFSGRRNDQSNHRNSNNCTSLSLQQRWGKGLSEGRCRRSRFNACNPSPTGELADSSNKGLQRHGPTREEESQVSQRILRDNPWHSLHWLPCRDGKYRPTGVVADSDPIRLQQYPKEPHRSRGGTGNSPLQSKGNLLSISGESGQRPTQPFIQPLAHGVPRRVGRLRAYGNAIVPQVAATFIQAVMETLGD